MKIKLAIIASLISFSAFTAYASTDENSYFKIQAGSTHFKKVKGINTYGSSKLRNSAVVGAEFGSKVNENVNLGLGIDYRPTVKTKNMLISQRASNMSFMVNAYYNFNEIETFKPYVGAGLGLGSTITKKSSLGKKHTKNNFAYQLMAGVNFALNETTDFNIGYRYLDMGKFNKIYKSRLKSNELLGGLTFKINS